MKKAFLSALIVVAIYFIILVSLLYGIRMDPSEGGPGWYFILFLLWGTPIFLAIAVRVFIKNYDLHRNPNSPLALKSALVVVAIYLIILVLLYIGVNIDLAEFEGTVGLGSLFGIFLFGGTLIFLVLALIVPLIVLVVGSIKDKKNGNSTTSAYLVGLKEDKKKGDSTTSNLWKILLSFIQSLIGW